MSHDEGTSTRAGAPGVSGGSGGVLRRVVQAFDVVFIMVLCFLTLWTTIRIQPDDGGEPSYAFNGWAFAGVGALLAVYLAYMLRHSERELKEMVEHVYAGEGPPAGEGEDPGKEREP